MYSIIGMAIYSIMNRNEIAAQFLLTSVLFACWSLFEIVIVLIKSIIPLQKEEY